MLGRVRVAGHSMSPTLEDGDGLLVAPLPPRAGDVVVAEDPRDPRRWVVKRVAAADQGALILTSDRPGHAALAVDRGAVRGRVLLRYAPLSRAGSLAAGRQ